MIISKNYALLGAGLALLILLFSMVASVPYSDLRYDRERLHQDLKTLEDSGKMSSNDILILTIYISRGELAGGSFEGKSYVDILANAKAFQDNGLQNKLDS